MKILRSILPLLLAAVLLFFMTTFARAQAIHTPKEGSAERKEIMDAIRPVFEKSLKQKVVFVVSVLKVNDEYAVAHVTPTKPDGSKIDYTHTEYQDKIKAGTFDENAHVLLGKGDKGTWEVIEYVFGDKEQAAKNVWADGYGVPKGMPN